MLLRANSRSSLFTRLDADRGENPILHTAWVENEHRVRLRRGSLGFHFALAEREYLVVRPRRPFAATFDGSFLCIPVVGFLLGTVVAKLHLPVCLLC